MPRIRSIKPEFPQSESMGRVSRDARLSFIMLWTLADDSGRLRGNSRMLASLLYPYDEDARGLIDAWLFELEKEGCIDRYVVEGDSYIEIRNWLTHQKIDKPSKSKIPAFVEASRTFSKPRERSSGDQGSGSEDLDQGSGSGSEDLSVPQRTAELVASLPKVQLITPATRIFDHWKSIHGHPRARLDAKRIKLINAALKLYDEATLCQSISGYLNSPHHMGTDPKGNGCKYDDIELMLRDAKHIDAGIRFHESGPAEPFMSPTTKQTLTGMQEFLQKSRGQ